MVLAAHELLRSAGRIALAHLQHWVPRLWPRCQGPKIFLRGALVSAMISGKKIKDRMSICEAGAACCHAHQKSRSGRKCSFCVNSRLRVLQRPR